MAGPRRSCLPRTPCELDRTCLLPIPLVMPGDQNRRATSTYYRLHVGMDLDRRPLRPRNGLLPLAWWNRRRRECNSALGTRFCRAATPNALPERLTRGDFAARRRHSHTLAVAGC